MAFEEGIPIPKIPTTVPRATDPYLSASIKMDLVLSRGNNPYIVDRYVTVEDDATLYLEPGVIVKFDTNRLLAIQGRLVVAGTPDQPVYFTSLKDDEVGGDTNGDRANSLPAMGDWGHIYFHSNQTHDDSILKHAVIRYGGLHREYGEYKGNDWYYSKPGPYSIIEYEGAIRLASSSPTIASCTLDTNTRAMYLSASSPKVIGNDFRYNSGFAITGDAQSLPDMNGNTFLDNGGNGFEVRGGTMISSSPTTYHWDDTDIVYAITGYTTVGEKVTLDIEPGMVIKFDTNKLLDIQGRFIAEGTPDQPIYFTSLKDDEAGGDTNGDGGNSLPAAGDWGNIYFHSNNRHADSVISHATIRYGGLHRGYGEYEGNDWYYSKPGPYSVIEYEGAIRLASSSPTIAGCTLNTNTRAMYLSASSPKVIGNDFRYNSGFAITGDAQSLPDMNGNTFLDNGGNGFEVRGGTMISSSPTTYHWDDTDIVYAITGYTTVGEKVTLDIEPGMVIKFDTNKLLDIQGRFIAEGTPDQPIYFTSLKDDEAGGDTNGDGGNSLPAAGDWGNIYFHSNNRHADSVISHATIRYGGLHREYGEYKGNNWYYSEPGQYSIIEYEGAIRLASSSPTIADCVITKNSYGLYLDESSAPTLRDNDVSGNSEGDILRP